MPEPRFEGALSCSKSLSILVVTRTYPPALGGSESETRNLAAALISRGHHVQIFCAGERTGDEHDSFGTPVHVLSRLTGRCSDIVFGFSVAAAVWSQRRNCDLIYFVMHGLQLLSVIPVAWWLGKPVAMKFSGPGAIASMMNSVTGLMGLALLRRFASKILILNDDMFAEAMQAGLPAGKVCKVRNLAGSDTLCVAAADRANRRTEKQLSPEAFVVVYTGRFAPEKNLEILIQAFRTVLDAVPQALLVLVGDGPEEPALRHSVQIHGVAESVRFTGRVSAQQVNEWLFVSDVFALVSRVEGLSCALLEAMSAGLPCVVSAIDGNRQIIDDDRHGIHVPVGNQELLAAALIRLAESPELRKQFGGEARKQYLRRCSPDQVVDEYEALFLEPFTPVRPATEVTADHSRNPASLSDRRRTAAGCGLADCQ